MTEEEKETYEELAELHATWKLGEETLKWWKNETGYVGVNIHKLCKIPLPHPESQVQIACLYLMHLDYVTKKLRKPATIKMKAEVFRFLKRRVKRHGQPVRSGKLFPW